MELIESTITNVLFCALNRKCDLIQIKTCAQYCKVWPFKGKLVMSIIEFRFPVYVIHYQVVLTCSLPKYVFLKVKVYEKSYMWTADERKLLLFFIGYLKDQFWKIFFRFEPVHFWQLKIWNKKRQIIHRLPAPSRWHRKNTFTTANFILF